MKFKIKEFRMIPTHLLDPHPEAEQFLRGEEDQSALNESVADSGVINPLHVIHNPDHKGRWYVIDGITRLNTTEKNPKEEMPCLICECDDVLRLVLTANCDRRRVSTGTRILSYLMRHKKIVLAAEDYFSALQIPRHVTGGGGCGHVTGGGYEPAELSNFSAFAIAQRLSVSNKDVGAAMELMRCHELKRCPQITQGGVVYKERPIDHKDKADAARYETVKSCLMAVMSGSMPIRKWRAGFAGRPVNEHGKDDVDYAALGFRSMTSLITVFNAWDKIDPQMRGDLLRKFEAVLKARQENVLSE